MQTRLLVLSIAFLSLFPLLGENAAYQKPIYSPSLEQQESLRNIVDGDSQSAWPGSSVFSFPLTLEIDLKGYFELRNIILISGKSAALLTLDDQAKAAGFWAVKNFKFEYWDDANWTPIPSTDLHENRLDSINFKLTDKILTSKIRLVCKDGESMPIREIKVLGDKKGVSFSVEEVSPLSHRIRSKKDDTCRVVITSKRVGRSMQYVGYNQGHYLPGSNVSGWLEYSNVNSFRVWSSLSDYVNKNWVESTSSIQTLDQFEARKRTLRTDPLAATIIDWQAIEKATQTVFPKSSNITNLAYALSELDRLGIDPILQINNRDFKSDWSNKWMQWQRFYALAFTVAKEWNATRFAIQNEPNHVHSGPMKVEAWIEAMQIVSDAVHCAIEDVNRCYNKQLKASFVGPVTAGVNTNWWSAILKNVRTDYKGDTLDYDLIDLFSTHSYNLPALGYASKVRDIQRVMHESHPKGDSIPICFTEIGRWMNGYLIDKEETLDSPSLFSQWGGMYAHNMVNGAYGMWAFKMANTSTSVYSRGVKSGHHFIWDGFRFVEERYTNLAYKRKVTTGFVPVSGKRSWVTDGDKQDRSAIVIPSSAGQKWVEIDLGTSQTIGAIVLYTGGAAGIYTAPDRVTSIAFSYWDGVSWHPIAEASEDKNKYAQTLYQLAQPIQAQKIRFSTVDTKEIRLREIKIFPYDEVRDLEESTDISSIQRAGEVVRLFAKGFKGQRELLQTSYNNPDEALDICTSFDSIQNRYYIWVVNRSQESKVMQLSTSFLPFTQGRIIGERVDEELHGGLFLSTHITSESLTIPVSPYSVSLLTCLATTEHKSHTPSQTFLVRGGTLVDPFYHKLTTLSVSLDPKEINNNQISYLQYNSLNIDKIKGAELTLTGSVSGAHIQTMRVTVYAFATPKDSWQTAPFLKTPFESQMTHVGREVKIVGQMVFTSKRQSHTLDITSVLQGLNTSDVIFTVIREVRHIGDDCDRGAQVVLDNKSAPAELTIYY